MGALKLLAGLGEVLVNLRVEGLDLGGGAQLGQVDLDVVHVLPRPGDERHLDAALRITRVSVPCLRRHDLSVPISDDRQFSFHSKVPMLMLMST